MIDAKCPLKWLPGCYLASKSATFVPESRRAQSVRDRGVGGSNPLAPSNFSPENVSDSHFDGRSRWAMNGHASGEKGMLKTC
jgi:hypothetical protein